MAHACELETSIYLALEPDLVQMDKAVREIPEWDSEHVWLDWSDGPLSVWPHWSGLSRSGVVGDASVATAEKGERLLSAAVDEIRAYIAEISARRRLRERTIIDEQEVDRRPRRACHDGHRAACLLLSRSSPSATARA